MSENNDAPSMQMYTGRNLMASLLFILLPAVILTAAIHVLAGPAAAFAPILLLPLLVTTGCGQYLMGNGEEPKGYLLHYAIAIALSSVYVILYSWEADVVMSVALATVFSSVYVLGLVLGDAAKWLKKNKMPQLDE